MIRRIALANVLAVTLIAAVLHIELPLARELVAA